MREKFLIGQKDDSENSDESKTSLFQQVHLPVLHIANDVSLHVAGDIAS